MLRTMTACDRNTEPWLHWMPSYVTFPIPIKSKTESRKVARLLWQSRKFGLLMACRALTGADTGVTRFDNRLIEPRLSLAPPADNRSQNRSEPTSMVVGSDIGRCM